MTTSSNIKDNVSAIKPADEAEAAQNVSPVDNEALVESAETAEAAEVASATPPAVADEPTPEFDLDSPELYLNRELTWLEFNRRVLHEGSTNPTRCSNASSSSASSAPISMNSS